MLVAVEQSVYQGLLDHLLSSFIHSNPSNPGDEGRLDLPIAGFLGGKVYQDDSQIAEEKATSVQCPQNDDMDTKSRSPLDSPKMQDHDTSSQRPSNGVSHTNTRKVILVKHFVPSQRVVPSLISQRLELVSAAFQAAKAHFEHYGVECVGWYKSASLGQPIYPQPEDISQLCEWQTSHPHMIGVVVGMKTTHPHSLSSTLSSPRCQLFSFDTHPSLKLVEIPTRIIPQPYLSPSALYESHLALLNTMHEARSTYLMQSSECHAMRGHQRLAVDNLYESHLLSFLRGPISQASRLIDQETIHLSYKKSQAHVYCSTCLGHHS